MKARLYVIPASHPSIAAQLMLEHKGIAYKRTDLLPVISKGVLRAVGFPGSHRAGAEDRRQARCRARARSPASSTACGPSRRCFPADPEKRAAVEEAERFGDEELQHPIRQILWWGIKQRPASRCAATPRAPSSASRSAWR